MPPRTPPVNHHAGHRAFSGAGGLLVGATLAVGRGGVARLACRSTDVGGGDRLVDVGCGPGTAVREAARRGAEAVGVDPAPPMLRLAGVLTATERVRWLAGVAESLPLPDAWATVWWSIATVHHWSDVEAGVAEAARVLAPGGRLLVIERRMGTEGTPRGHGWSESQAHAFAEACGSAGFLHPQVERARAGRRTLVTVRAVAP